jgi:GH15 family glucan-1,4-alpha-glucosidase
MELALIGNCAYQALIDGQASVVWLCWPRFDSSFVFGALLDEERGGVFSVEPDGPFEKTEQAYIPNTNIVRTVFHLPSGCFEVVDFAPRFKQYERSFKPAMLIRRLRRLSGEPVIRIRCRPTHDYGRINPDRHTASNHIQWHIPGAQLRMTTNVPLAYVVEESGFLLENEAWIVLTWGEPLEAELVETCTGFLSRTQAYWERWVKHTALPGQFQKEVVRSALALKLHQYEDTGAITAATTTSLPEYPGAGRNWDYRFCWLRDAYFTVRAMRRLGHFDEMEAFLTFLKNVAAAHERLQPVYAISGRAQLHEEELNHLSGFEGNRPVRAGNAAYLQVQNDVYGEMLAALAPFYSDFRFEEHVTEYSHRLVKRLLRRISDSMELPDAGIWEIRDDSRIHTFSLLFHWVGGTVAARIAERIGDPELRKSAFEITERARGLIEGCFHPERGYYGDSTVTSNADAALLMMVNLGYLHRGHPHAESHVRALARELSVNGHLMHRYKHHDGIGDTHATFTVCGFWYVEALARLGSTDEAREAFEQLLTYVNHVGLLSEDVNPKNGQQLGNFPQTYSHVGLINAAFAISPVPVEVGDY